MAAWMWAAESKRGGHAEHAAGPAEAAEERRHRIVEEELRRLLSACLRRAGGLGGRRQLQALGQHVAAGVLAAGARAATAVDAC